MDNVNNLLWGIQRSIFYHDRRRAFLYNMLFIYPALALSACVTGFILAGLYDKVVLSLVIYLVIFITANIKTIFSYKLVRQHNDLYSLFIELEKKIYATPNPSKKDISNWTCERLDIESKEPPVLKVLDIMCHNELLRARGYDVNMQVKISRLQRLFANFFDFKEYDIS
ncbi:MAG: hypothetical protein QM504_06480 [Pseudomonadota bacterium]